VATAVTIGLTGTAASISRQNWSEQLQSLMASRSQSGVVTKSILLLATPWWLPDGRDTGRPGRLDNGDGVLTVLMNHELAESAQQRTRAFQVDDPQGRPVGGGR
jgi:hypothetical protein